MTIPTIEFEINTVLHAFVPVLSVVDMDTDVTPNPSIPLDNSPDITTDLIQDSSGGGFAPIEVPFYNRCQDANFDDGETVWVPQGGTDSFNQGGNGRSYKRPNGSGPGVIDVLSVVETNEIGKAYTLYYQVSYTFSGDIYFEVKLDEGGPNERIDTYTVQGPLGSYERLQFSGPGVSGTNVKTTIRVYTPIVADTDQFQLRRCCFSWMDNNERYSPTILPFMPGSTDNGTNVVYSDPSYITIPLDQNNVAAQFTIAFFGRYYGFHSPPNNDVPVLNFEGQSAFEQLEVDRLSGRLKFGSVEAENAVDTSGAEHFYCVSYSSIEDQFLVWVDGVRELTVHSVGFVGSLTNVWFLQNLAGSGAFWPGMSRQFVLAGQFLDNVTALALYEAAASSSLTASGFNPPQEVIINAEGIE